MDWLLTSRPSGAVGAEGAGTGWSVGGNRGRGAPDRAGPLPPMRGCVCRAVWGEGGRSQPGSVAVWTGAPFFWRARPHPDATLAEATVSAAPFEISTRYVAVTDDGRPYALDFFRLHWNRTWRDDDESKRHSKLAKSPPALLPTV